MAKVKGFVPRTFRDRGTGEEFVGGKEHSFEPGAFGNYRACGLAIEPEEKAPAAEPAPKKGS